MRKIIKTTFIPQFSGSRTSLRNVLSKMFLILTLIVDFYSNFSIYLFSKFNIFYSDCGIPGVEGNGMVHGQKEAGSGTPSQRETRSVMDLDPDTQRSTEGGGLCTVNLAYKCPPILD